MMKKLLVLLLSAMMVFSLVACGGEDTSSGYTDEQQEYVDAYEQMLKDYQTAIDLANKTTELANDKELADLMNDLTDSIDEMTDMVSNPENLTDDFMAAMETVIENAYFIIERVEAYAELLPILTVSGVGSDEEGNSYWFACNDEKTVAALVILSADEKEHVYCIGEMSVNPETVKYTISDEDGYTTTFSLQIIVDEIIITFEDGTRVYFDAASPREVIEAIFSIQENTENVNP